MPDSVQWQYQHGYIRDDVDGSGSDEGNIHIDTVAWQLWLPYLCSWRALEDLDERDRGVQQ